MAMFALAIFPLIMKLMEVCQTVYQVWFADDATAAASGEQLKQWWDALSIFGPHFGYSPNATKTILVVKDEHGQTANSLFSAFFDVRVFHPNAPTYRYRDLAALYKMHEGIKIPNTCLLYTSPSPRDRQKSRMPSSA